jgi:hypothetical protein
VSLTVGSRERVCKKQEIREIFKSDLGNHPAGRARRKY